LNQVTKQKRINYNDKMRRVKEWTEPLDPSVIANKIDEVDNTYGVTKTVAEDGTTSIGRTSKSRLNASELDEVSSVMKEVDEWMADPGNNFTPEDFDVLKGRVSEFYSESSKARGYVEEVRVAVYNEIADNVPGYAPAMREYEAFSNLERELKTTMSLGDKKSIDTAFKKLGSTFRSNFEGRKEILAAVKELGIDADSVLDKVAGLQMRDYSPKGLMGQMATGTGLVSAGTLSAAGILNPQLLVMFAATSPKVVATTLSSLGWSSKQVGKFLNAPVVKQLKKGVTTTAGRAVTSNLGRYTDLIYNHTSHDKAKK
jgi:hypothetical protein